MLENDVMPFQTIPRKYPSRIGRITELNQDTARVKVEFEHNPLNQPVWAMLGRAFSYDAIHMAIDNKLDCRIEFISDDLELPTVVDIYMSLLGVDELVIKAKRVVLDGEDEVVIRSGSAQSKYSGCDSRVSTSADHINSTAERMQKIQGSKISLN
ncbi:hypothetical protein [Vibrio campbellii]|uniref:hypothetical protein n=1 Tax=Vibrio campbellii TaxID=680 RepID=UPI00210A3797|nr:hypothetical protein [Vibrio campbellii]